MRTQVQSRVGERMEQDKNKAPVDWEEKPKAKRGTCRKPAAKKKAEKPNKCTRPWQFKRK